jgi:hypothetical protein
VFEWFDEPQPDRCLCHLHHQFRQTQNQTGAKLHPDYRQQEIFSPVLAGQSGREHLLLWRFLWQTPERRPYCQRAKSEPDLEAL